MCSSLEIIKSFNSSKPPSMKTSALSLWFAHTEPIARWASALRMSGFILFSLDF